MSLIPSKTFKDKCDQVLKELKEEHPSLKKFSEQLRRGGAWNINGIQQFIALQLDQELHKEITQEKKMQLLARVQVISDESLSDELDELPEKTMEEFLVKQLAISWNDLYQERKESALEITELKKRIARLDGEARTWKCLASTEACLKEDAREKYQRMKRKRNELRAEKNKVQKYSTK